MGALDRVRRLIDRLPLGEAPPEGHGLRPTAATKAELARALEPGETPRWAGWIYAARGAGPEDGLDEAAAVVTDQRIVWMPRPDHLNLDSERLGDVRRLMVDRKSNRLLLVTDDHGMDSPGVAVLFGWDRDLHDAIQRGRGDQDPPDAS